MSNDCIFCKLASREIPSNVVCETDEVFAFHDLNPHAPVHVLVIPKVHVSNLAAAIDTQTLLLGKLMRAAVEVAKLTGIAETGYRTVVNVGHNGGQSVDHLHVHVLGGRHLGWPPG